MGHVCDFICADLDGNLSNLILRDGFELKLISRPKFKKKNHNLLNWNNYAKWLGVIMGRRFKPNQINFRKEKI